MKPSFWERTTFLAPADLAIIGSGITGLSIAYYVKKANPSARIVVLEKGMLPSGASTRNAGFACFGSVSELLDDLDLAPEEVVAARVARRISGLQRLRRELGDDAIGYEDCGGWEIFTDARQAARCVDAIPRLNHLIAQASGQRDAFHASSKNGWPAIACPSEGALHSGMLIQTLHRRVLELGVSVLGGADVASIHRDGDRMRILLKDGIDLQADLAVVASNGFAASLLDVPIVPARGQILVSRPMTGLPWHGIFHYDAGYVYFRHLRGDAGVLAAPGATSKPAPAATSEPAATDAPLRLLLGGARHQDIAGERTSEEGSNSIIKEWLLDFADHVLKVPLRTELEMEWSGVMGFTPDKDPICREHQPGIWVVAGLSGIGVSIGMQTAFEAASSLSQAMSV
jgi:gamma-glutamylputrescine oxidase